MRLLTLLLLAGCGRPVDFAGVYDGTLDLAETCDDASKYTHTATVSWSIFDSADTVITPDATAVLNCTSLHAAVVGRVATVKALVACVEIVVDGVGVKDTVKSGGTLTLDGENLHVDLGLVTILAFSNGTKPQCAGPLSGVLIKR